MAGLPGTAHRKEREHHSDKSQSRSMLALIGV